MYVYAYDVVMYVVLMCMYMSVGLYGYLGKNVFDDYSPASAVSDE